jgi:hypothetical protein
MVLRLLSRVEVCSIDDKKSEIGRFLNISFGIYYYRHITSCPIQKCHDGLICFLLCFLKHKCKIHFVFLVMPSSEITQWFDLFFSVYELSLISFQSGMMKVSQIVY